MTDDRLEQQKEGQVITYGGVSMGIPNPLELWHEAKSRIAAERERRREEERLAEEERRRLEEERRRFEEEARQAHIAELMTTDDKELLVRAILTLEELQKHMAEFSDQFEELQRDVSFQLDDLQQDVSRLQFLIS